MRGVDGPAQRVGVALDQRVVGLVDGAVAEGVLQHRVGVLGLGDHHHAGGADVQGSLQARPRVHAAEQVAHVARAAAQQHAGRQARAMSDGASDDKRGVGIE
mgnify:CR=1 FL=1